MYSKVSITALCISIINVLVTLMAALTPDESIVSGVEGTLPAGPGSKYLAAFALLLTAAIVMIIIDLTGEHRKKTLTKASIIINACSMLICAANMV
jgi:hypothetical protein